MGDGGFGLELSLRMDCLKRPRRSGVKDAIRSFAEDGLPRSCHDLHSMEVVMDCG